MAADPNCEACKKREERSQLHPDVLGRIVVVLGTQIQDVYAKQRELEQSTELADAAGRSNLAEAFAHLATLFQKAGSLDRDEQLEQVAFLEDHLRRVMMEAFELATYRIIGNFRKTDDGKNLERAYYRRAAPLVRRGRLAGHITPEAYEKGIERITQRCIEARAAKVSDGDWDDWKRASTELEAAAEEVGDLFLKVRGAVDAATNTWRWVFGIALALVLFVLSHVLF